MHPEKINTTCLLTFINQVKAADSSKQREIKIDINTAKLMSHTLALCMTRLAGNYEDLITSNQPQSAEPITVSMDGGSWNNS